MLGNTPNQPTKLKRKGWVQIDDESRRTYNTNSQIRLKTSMLMWRFCGYSAAYILVSGNVTVKNTAWAAAAVNNTNIQAVFKISARFTNLISEINNTQIENAKGIDVIMTMYSLIEYSNNYSKKSGSLSQYYRDEPALNDDVTVANFPGNSGIVVRLN